MTAKPQPADLLALATKLRNLAGVIRKYGTCAPMALEKFADELQAAIESLAAQRNTKAQAFKDYVHQRLDAMGVPHSVPESEHDKAGCRVGGRLDFVEAHLAAHRGEAVPGVMHCAKCKFRLVRTNLYVRDGTTGPGDNTTEPCPNGCGPLWPVTWENEARECWARVEELAHPPQAQTVPSCPAIDADKPTDPDHKRLAALADWIDVLAPGRSLSARSYLLELSRKLAQSTPQAQAGAGDAC